MQLDLRETKSERPYVRLNMWGVFLACITKEVSVLFCERENTGRGAGLGERITCFSV